MKYLLVAAALVLLLAPQANAANCWWTPAGVVTVPGWVWVDGRCMSEYELRERHRERHEEREHYHGHDYGDRYRYDHP